MTSLYGGKQGLSFNLRHTYTSVAAMNEAFSGNDEYTDVWYGDYCIIDSPNKNNPENGSLYRRDFNGATYIGRIVGATAGNPAISFGKLEEVEGKDNTYQLPEEFVAKADEEINLQYKDNNGDTKIIKAYLKESESISTSGITFVAGRETENGINPNNATLTYTNLRTDDSEIGSFTLINDLSLPSLTTNFYGGDAQSPYDENGSFKPQTTITPISNFKVNNFYQEYEIITSHGAIGPGFLNLSIKTGSELSSENVNVYDIKTFNFDDPKSSSPQATLENDFYYWIVSWCDYRVSKNGDKYLLNIGPYDTYNNVEWNAETAKLVFTATAGEDKTVTIPYVNDIEMPESGKKGFLTFKFAGGDSKSFTFTPISDIKIDSTTGEMVKKYYGIEDETKSTLSFIKAFQVNDQTGQIQYQLTSDKEGVWHDVDGDFKYPRKIEFKSETGTLIVSNSTVPTLDETEPEAREDKYYIPTITNIEIDDDGNLIKSYTSEGEAGKDNLTYSGTFNSVRKILLDPQDDETLNLSYTTATNHNNESAKHETDPVPFIKDFSVLDTNDPFYFNAGNELSGWQNSELDPLQGDRKIHAKYKGALYNAEENKSEIVAKEAVSPSINSIADMCVHRGNLYVLYADPEKRKEALNAQKEVLPGWSGTVPGTTYNFLTNDLVKEGNFYWQKIGEVNPEGIVFADVYNGIDIPDMTIPSENDSEIKIEKNTTKGAFDYLSNYFLPGETFELGGTASFGENDIRTSDLVRERICEGKIIAFRFDSNLESTSESDLNNKHKDSPFTNYYLCERLNCGPDSDGKYAMERGGTWRLVQTVYDKQSNNVPSDTQDEIIIIDENEDKDTLSEKYALLLSEVNFSELNFNDVFPN